MVEDFLELCCCFVALMCSKKGFSSHIDRIQIRPIVTTKRRQPQFKWSSDSKNIDRLLRVCTKERKLCTKSRQVIQLQERIFGKPLAQIICQGACSVHFPCIGKSQRQGVVHIPPGRTSLRESDLLPCPDYVSEQRFPQRRRSVVGCRSFLFRC